MKVYVVTEAKVFEPERYLFVRQSKKAAEKDLRKIAPYMRPTSNASTKVSTYITDKTNQTLFFIHEEEI